MNSRFAVIFFAMLVCVATAQEQPVPPLFEGMPLSVSLTHDLGTYKAKVGDRVELVFSGEVKDKNGNVLLQRKSKITGRVTDVAKRDKQHPEARLAILLDRADSNGVSVPLHAVLCGDLRALKITKKVIEPVPNGPSSTSRSPGYLRNPTTNWRVPDDAELKPMTDPNIGATLVSSQDNILLGSGPTFFICQQTAASASPSTLPIVAPPSLPPGVTLIVSLQSALDASNAKNGDSVRLLMATNLLGPGQTIAIPKDAEVQGRVVLAQPASNSTPSRLELVIDRASWSGASVPLNASIVQPPTLPQALMPQMLRKAGRIDVNLRDISVEELPSGGSGLLRNGETIRLPEGTQLTFRTR